MSDRSRSYSTSPVRRRHDSEDSIHSSPAKRRERLDTPSPSPDRRTKASRSRSRSPSWSSSTRRSKRGRSRSRSPDRSRTRPDRRRSRSRSSGDSSRSRSRSRSRDRRGRDKEKRKKEKKRQSKKKSKKSKKKDRREKRDEELPSLRDEPQHAQELKAPEKPTEANIKTASISKKDFFSNLMAQESAKAPIGTSHSLASKGTTALDDQAANKGDWICQRRNCGTSNYKFSTQCHKCGAMKRMTEYR